MDSMREVGATGKGGQESGRCGPSLQPRFAASVPSGSGVRQVGPKLQTVRKGPLHVPPAAAEGPGSSLKTRRQRHVWHVVAAQ